MKRIELSRVGLVLASLMGGALLLPAGQAVAAQVTQVFITNDAAHAVPIAGSVSVSNLPATQAVSGTVQVTEIPEQQFLTASNSLTAGEDCTAVTVPVGKKVRVDAVQFEAVQLDGTSNQPIAYVLVVHSTANASNLVRFSATDWAVRSGSPRWSASFHGPLFAEPSGTEGDHVSICAGATTSLRAFVSGVLVG